jgi:hypothetical protein
MSKESGPFPVSKEPIQELIPHRGVLQSGSVQPEGIRNATVLRVKAGKTREHRASVEFAGWHSAYLLYRWHEK